MMQSFILVACFAHALVAATNQGFGGPSFGTGGRSPFGSNLAGNKLGGTSTLRKRGVIVDPLSNTGFGKSNILDGKAGRLGGDGGVSLLSNDDLFRSPQLVDGSFGGSSKGIGGSFGSSKGVGTSFGSSKGLGDGSFSTSKLGGGSFGSSKGVSSSFGSSKSIGGSFGSSKGAGSSFGSSKGIGGGSFDNSKNVGGGFGPTKVVGTSFGQSQGIGGSFGSKNVAGSFGSPKGIAGSFGTQKSFSRPGNAIKSIDGGFGGGNVFSKGNTLAGGKGSAGSFSKDSPFSSNYIDSFNSGFGIQNDGNIFGDRGSLIGGGKQLPVSGGFGQSGIYGGNNVIGGKSSGFGSGIVNTGYGQDFQSKPSGFAKSNSISNKGGSFGGKGFSSNNIRQGFANFDEGKGFGEVRRDYGIGDRNVIGNKGSFGGGSILPQVSKSGGFLSQGGLGSKSIGIDKGGFDSGYGNFDIVGGGNKGIGFDNQGIISAGGAKGFDQALYSTNDGRNPVFSSNPYGGNAFVGKSNVQGPQIRDW